MATDAETDVELLSKRYSKSFRKAEEVEDADVVDSFSFVLEATDPEFDFKDAWNRSNRVYVTIMKGYPSVPPRFRVRIDSEDPALKLCGTKVEASLIKTTKRVGKRLNLRKLFRKTDHKMARICRVKSETVVATGNGSLECRSCNNAKGNKWTAVEQSRLDAALRNAPIQGISTKSQAEKAAYWQRIAIHIGERKTPIDCLIRYRSLRLRHLRARGAGFETAGKDLRIAEAYRREGRIVVQDRKDGRGERYGSGGGSSGEEREQKEEDEEEKEAHTGFDENQSDVSPLSSSLSTGRGGGARVSLANVVMNGVGLIQLHSIRVLVKCARCRHQNSFHVDDDEKITTSACTRCRVNIVLRYRGSAVHRNSNDFGFIESLSRNVSGIEDMLKCDVAMTCGKCGSVENAKQVRPIGETVRRFCHKCHSTLSFSCAAVRFGKLASFLSKGSDEGTTRSSARHEKKQHFARGKPLPDNGTCKHYRKSCRWFRFPCCGRAFPCDVCHDEAGACHERGRRATREICGLCGHDQAISSAKKASCAKCSGNLTKSSSSSRHWEGGGGCRNTTRMSRKDRAKFRGRTKTTSNKKKESGAAGTKKKKKKS
eukprot:g733.t1